MVGAGARREARLVLHVAVVPPAAAPAAPKRHTERASLPCSSVVCLPAKRPSHGRRHRPRARNTETVTKQLAQRCARPLPKVNGVMPTKL
jgi:hypothetical protein